MVSHCSTLFFSSFFNYNCPSPIPVESPVRPPHSSGSSHTTSLGTTRSTVSVCLENRPRSHRGLAPACRASEQGVTDNARLRPATLGALEAAWPSQADQILPASRFRRKPGFKLRDRTRVIFHRTPHYILGSAEPNGCPVTLFQSSLLSPHAGCRHLSELLSNQKRLKKPVPVEPASALIDEKIKGTWRLAREDARQSARNHT
jgi:hypothetical protein